MDASALSQTLNAVGTITVTPSYGANMALDASGTLVKNGTATTITVANGAISGQKMAGGAYSIIYTAGESMNVNFSYINLGGTAYPNRKAAFKTSLLSGKRYTLTAKLQNIEDLMPGSGKLKGKTCFDIAFSNDNANKCATLLSRTFGKTDFAQTAEQDPALGEVTGGSGYKYTAKQVYTFTTTLAVSNVRFVAIDPMDEIVESITPKADYSGSFAADAEFKATVLYKSSLNTSLQGLTSANAKTYKLYAIYTYNGADYTVPLSIRLQDCDCCGAMTTNNTWLRFKCHNIGADENLDPMSFVEGNKDGSGGTLGYLYQWGRPSDGHQIRNSNSTTTLATSDIPGHGDFIIDALNANNGDWRSGGGSPTRWGDGSDNVNMPRGSNDPCPSGWKVPSRKQWGIIFGGETVSGSLSLATANTWTWTGNGFKVGDYLFLPEAGYRNGDTVNSVGGFYWSSTVFEANAYQLLFASTSVYSSRSYTRGRGNSVRCVEE